MESLTGQKIPDKQISELKNALKEVEFKKITPDVLEKNRKSWKNNKDKLIKEWEQNTGQKWPKHQIGEKVRGRIITTEQYYEGHHLIQLDHGGPNFWWNIHPMRDTDHIEVHTTGGSGYIIFKQNIKK